MLPAADWPVTIVIYLNVLWSPGECNRKVRCETKAHRRSQALWPRFDRTKRRLGPIHRPDQLAHFSAADQPVGHVSGLLRNCPIPTIIWQECFWHSASLPLDFYRRD